MSIKWKKVIALIVAIILSAGSIMQTVAATPTEVENEVEVTDTPENGEKKI